MNTSTVIPRLEGFEGRIHYMYKCTGGDVTIGIGHAILTPADALNLPWSVNGSPADPGQIQTDYAAIAAAPKGPEAPAFQHLTQCRMADSDIEALVAADLPRFEADLVAKLPNWNTYPEPAQEALFDMGFNLGVSGLLKFHDMFAAINAGNWTEAAAQCHRKGINEDRNQATAALFLQAAR